MIGRLLSGRDRVSDFGEQDVDVHRLAEIRARADGERTRPFLVVFSSGDDDRRDVDAVCEEPGLDVKPTESWHLRVEDQTVGTQSLAQRFEQLLGGAERAGV